MPCIKTLSRQIFGTFFVVAGANHFWHTGFYIRIMPPILPWHRELVIISGIAEILLGTMLLVRRWSAPAAWGLMALLVAVFPANIHMALHPELYPWASPAALWLRLPAQALLIMWAYCYAEKDTVHRQTDTPPNGCGSSEGYQ
jgi:uncharacterized membrane protein